MFRAISTFLAIASLCFDAAFAYTDCYTDDLSPYVCYDNQYCCGYMSCCENYVSIWGLWYFWIILIFVLAIISSCVGYCVRSARLRQMARYQQLTRTQTSGYGTSTTVRVEQVATPYSTAMGGLVAPPPYNGAASGKPTAPPAYHQ